MGIHRWPVGTSHAELVNNMPQKYKQAHYLSHISGGFCLLRPNRLNRKSSGSEQYAHNGHLGPFYAFWEMLFEQLNALCVENALKCVKVSKHWCVTYVKNVFIWLQLLPCSLMIILSCKVYYQNMMWQDAFIFVQLWRQTFCYVFYRIVGQ